MRNVSNPKGSRRLREAGESLSASSPPEAIQTSTAAELAAFLNYIRVERGLAANSIASYERDLREFARFLRRRGRALSAVDREDIRDFLASLYRRGLSARSAARHLVSLRNLFKFLLKEGKRKTDPTREIDAPRIGQSLP
jgi:integrase/recombinase XerD